MSTAEARLPRFARHDGRFQVAELVSALEGWWQPVDVARGERLFVEGEPSDALFVVVEGELRVEVMTDDVDTDAVLSFTGPGSVLGELGLITRGPRSATAIAVDDVRLQRLTAGDLDALCDHDPVLGLAVYRMLASAVSDRVRRRDAQTAPAVFATADDPVVDRVLNASLAAQAELVTWSEERIDGLLRDVARALPVRRLARRG